MKTFKGDFDKLLNKVQNQENFAFSRFSDGELFILQNKELILGDNLIKVGNKRQPGGYTKEDHKHFKPEEHQEQREALIAAFKHNQEGFYKGISCRCCVGQKSFDWQLRALGGYNEHLTWSNLPMNSNYPDFLSKMVPEFSKRPVVMVCNKMCKLEELPFEVTKDFRIGSNAFIKDFPLVQTVYDFVKENDVEGHIFLFAASSLSNLIIHALYKDFSENTYIDIGTTLNPLMDMRMDREYLTRHWGGHGGLQECIW